MCGDSFNGLVFYDKNNILSEINGLNGLVFLSLLLFGVCFSVLELDMSIIDYFAVSHDKYLLYL